MRRLSNLLLASAGIVFAVYLVFPITALQHSLLTQTLGLMGASVLILSAKIHRPKAIVSWWTGSFTMAMAGSLELAQLIDDSHQFGGRLFNTAGGIVAISAGTTYIIWMRAKKSRWEMSAVLDSTILISAVFVTIWEMMLRIRWHGDLPSSAELSEPVVLLLISLWTCVTAFHVMRSATAGFVPAFRLFVLQCVVSASTNIAAVTFDESVFGVRMGLMALPVPLLICSAMAAHPTMVHFTEPAPPVMARFGKRQLTILAFALVVPVATVVVSSYFSQTPDLRVWLPLSVMSLVCVALRIGTIMRERDAQQREISLHATRQTSLASFGKNALVTLDLAIVMRDATEVVESNLKVSEVGVWVRESQDSIRLRAGSASGLAPLLAVNSQTNPVPVAVAAAQTGETQHREGEIAVPIGSNDHVFGVLTARGLRFNDDELLFLEQVATVLAMAMRRHDDEQDRRQSQRLEAIGRLSGGLAHEINTPIQFMSSNLHFLRRTFDELLKPESQNYDYLAEEVPAAIREFDEGLERITQIVGAMKTFGDNDKEASMIDVRVAWETTLAVAQTEIDHLEYFALEWGDVPELLCKPSELNQLFLSLLLNAVEAIGRTDRVGRIAIKTELIDDLLQVSVSDNGCGISTEIADNIWDPFFTTKELGQGTGQGLTLSRTIVKNLDGEITFVTHAEGTTFIVQLPVRAS